MSQTPCTCPNANMTFPTSDISTLAPLSPEIQGRIFDILTARPCRTHTFTLSRFSKSRYATFIPRLYGHLVVSDETIERGLFTGLLDDLRDPNTTTPKPIPSKRTVLKYCQSLMLLSLSASDIAACWAGPTSGVKPLPLATPTARRPSTSLAYSTMSPTLLSGQTASRLRE
ncbi:hypothetical protein IAR50_004321 [Cryptococcus sp. DSM 104548]